MRFSQIFKNHISETLSPINLSTGALCCSFHTLLYKRSASVKVVFVIVWALCGTRM